MRPPGRPKGEYRSAQHESTPVNAFDYKPFVKPESAPRMTKAGVRMTLDNYPPRLERLLGAWGPLSREPFVGITADGDKVEGLFRLQPDGAPVAAAAQAAGRWLDGLDPQIRSKVQFAVDSDMWRHWHNTPLMFRDPQVELLELTMEQRELALDVVRASLSQEGYRRARTVMENNLFLGNLVGLTEVLNDWAFSLSIFGRPSSDTPWGWQFFGHHLALNCMFIRGQMVLSPVFMGLEPDHDGTPARRRMFEPHERRALELFRSLNGSEQRRARLYDSMFKRDQPPGRYHPDDGRQVGGAFRDNRVVPYEGVPVAALGARQRRRLLAMLEPFIFNMPDGPAEGRMREIERFLNQTFFAWIGPANEVDPFYFRVHSPVALVELDHHSGIFLANEDPARFHVHTIVRTPNGGDYGADLLRHHYALGGHGDDGHDSGAAHSHDGGLTFHHHKKNP